MPDQFRFHKTQIIYNIMQEKPQQSQPKTLIKSKNPFLLKFTTLQRPNRIQSLNRLNYPQNLQKDGTIIAKRDIIQHQLFDHHVVQNNIRIQGSLKKLNAAFIHDKVPQFYAYHFMNRLVHASEEKIQDKILKQLEQIKAKRSFFHVISNAIKARQGCLKQLQRCLDNLFNNEEDNLTKHVFREQIMHYRKLTGFVINHIRAWKQALNQISPQIYFTTYLYRNEDYLIKLLNDCEFIFNSFLTKHLKFSFRNDPYIMRPFVDGKQSKYLDIFKFDEVQKGNFMIDLNFQASQRAKYLEQKMNSKSDKLKEIQRIYQYKDTPLSSRIIVKRSQSRAQKREFNEQKQGKQKLQGLVDNYMSQNQSLIDERKRKMNELNKKDQKIKKIKQIFGKTSQSSTRLINPQMFETIHRADSANKLEISPYQKKLRYTEFHSKKLNFEAMNFQSDFENLLRKKELQVLKTGGVDNASDNLKTQRSFKNIKIKDNLSESRKFISKQQGMNQLQKLLNQLDTFSPQKLQNFKLKKKQDPASSSLMIFNEGKTAKSRLIEPKKTLLQHNEQVYLNVRNQVIQQIEKDQSQKAYLQEKRRKENQEIQELLQKKINQQSLKIINDSRVKQLQGRQHLAKQMSSLQLFGYEQPKINNSQKLSYVQEELKKQMQLKWLRQVQQQLKRKTDLSQLQKIRIKQQKQLNKKVEKAKQKQQLQKRYQEIQREQRSKVIQKQIQLDEQRKKQIENEMKIVIQRQKKNMQRFAATQKVEVQQQLRQAMKVQFLENIKKQNAKFYEDTKKQQQIALKQKQYRDEVRSRIEEEYKIGQQLKQNRERQQKVAKLRLVKQKLGEFDKSSRKQGNESKIENMIKNESLQIKKSQQAVNLQQMKSRITQFPDFRESVFPKYQKDSQKDKKKLRQQFQLELFSFKKAETYEQNNVAQSKYIYKEGQIPIKDFRNMIGKQMKQKQLEQERQQNKQKSLIQGNQKPNQNIPLIKISKPNQIVQKQQAKMQVFNQMLFKDDKSQMGKTVKSSVESQKFTRFSQNKNKFDEKQRNQQDQLIRMKLGMTFEQYQIYKKKKNAITARRDIQAENKRRRIHQEKDEVVKVIDQFKKMDNLNIKQNQFNNIKDLQKSSLIDDNLFDNLSTMKQQQNNKKKIKDNNVIIQQDLEQIDQNVKVDQGKHRKNLDEEEQSPRKAKSPKKIKKQQNDNDDIISINSRVTSYVEKRFATSGSQEQGEQRKPKKQMRKTSKKKKLEQIRQQESDIQQLQPQKGKTKAKKNQKSRMSMRKQDQNIKKQQPKPAITKIKMRQIPVASLQSFFNDHFQHLPKVIKKINIYKKQELIKFLLQHQSFTILEYIKQSVSIGMGIILFNENKSKYRSLNIVHLGSYDQQDYLQLLLSIVKYCFRNDPCQQIAMSNIYDKEVSDQWQFVKKFEKKFDPYGAIFQKKIFNSQFERKFVLRRNIGQQCHVRPVSHFNRGLLKLQMNNIIVQSIKKQQVSQILEADNYNQVGYYISYPGWLGHYLAQRYSEDALALLITKGTIKDSSMRQKSIGSLAKLSLSIKKNQSFQRMSQISQIKQDKYSDIMSLNLDLIAKKQAVLSYPPQQIQTPIQCTWLGFKDDIQLSYDFYSQTIPIKVFQRKNDDGDDYICKYLRFTPNKKNKMFVLKSSAYSTKVKVLPCKSTKYKIFIMDSQQYKDILQKQKNNEQNKLDLSVYLRVLFGNVPHHQIADYDHVWIPQINIKQNKNQLSLLQQFAQAQIQTKGMSQQNKILNKQQLYSNGIIRSQLNLTYTDYLGNSLKIQPTHRDLVITPPFIIGILNMQIQTAQQGSPIYVKKVEKNDLSWIKEVQKLRKIQID